MSQELKFGVRGMSCASCVSRVERVLNKQRGVSEAQVNLAAGTARLVVDEREADLDQILAAVDDAGYEPAVAEDEIAIAGMTCASCVRRVEKAITRLAGVQSVSINLTTGKAHLRYLPETVDLSRIAEAVGEAGYEARLAAEAKTPIYAAVDGQLAAVLAVADPVKRSSAETIGALHRMGIRAAMVTGDNAATADAIARQVGLDSVMAEVLPDSKAEEVRRLQGSGETVAFVGDGINDAPALAQADAGIAIGTGTDIAIEAGDVVLMRSDLRELVNAMALARRTRRTIHLNFFWAYGYNVSLIPVAAGVLYSLTGWLLNPMAAAAAMSLSSVFVLTNSLRLRRFAPALVHASSPEPLGRPTRRQEEGVPGGGWRTDPRHGRSARPAIFTGSRLLGWYRRSGRPRIRKTHRKQPMPSIV